MSFGIPVRNGLGVGLLASTFLSSLRIGGRPAMFLNFIGTNSLDSRVTFTRATTATFVGSNGFIQSAAINAPRFDYNPTTLAPRGLLIEESRTNLATYSNDFTDVSWIALGAKNLVANSTVSPDGGTNASTLTDNSAVAFQGINKTFVVVNNNASYTASIYVRKTTGGTSATFGFNLQLTGGTLVAASPRINTDTGAVLSGSATVQNAGAYWRITSTVTNNTTGNIALALSIYPATSAYNVPTDSSAATGSAIIYGVQVEAGAFATSYIPTVASTVTRNADNATITGTNFSSWYNQTEGTFVVGADTAQAAANRILEASGGTSARVVDLSVAVGQFLQMYNGTTAFNASGSVTLNTPFKAVGAYKTANYGVALNGGTVAANTDALVNTANALQIGRFNTSSNYLNGHIRQIAYYNTRLPNATLQALTA